MLDLGTTMIAALAAILSSLLTIYFTHDFERRQHKKEYELKWLEERFGPALDFLGRVLAIVSHADNTPEGRKQIADEIHKVVVGPAKETNAWCIGVLLDPEDTGIRDLVLETMAYARITEGEKEFIGYQAKLHWNLGTLAEEFRKERQAIASGKSLETLIKQRKTNLEKRAQRFGKALGALRAFCDNEMDLSSTLRDIKSSGIQGVELETVFKIMSNVGDTPKQERLGAVRRECEERGWLSESMRR